MAKRKARKKKSTSHSPPGTYVGELTVGTPISTYATSDTVTVTSTGSGSTTWPSGYITITPGTSSGGFQQYYTYVPEPYLRAPVDKTPKLKNGFRTLLMSEIRRVLNLIELDMEEDEEDTLHLSLADYFDEYDPETALTVTLEKLVKEQHEYDRDHS
jgi:hypothetical protein